MKNSPNIDAQFEVFVQELPADYQAMAYEFKAFCRSRKVQSVYELLQLVMLYCGLDFSLRTTAGQFSSANGYLSDTAVRKRLAACVPWVKAILTKVFNLGQVVTSGHLRFIVIDASTIQVPGADGTSYRLHIAIDLVKLELLEVKVTDEKQGEGLCHYTLKNGDVVVIDRGYNQPKNLVPFIDQGGDIVLRYNPHGMNLYSQNDEMVKIAWATELKKFDGSGVIPVYLCHGDKRIASVVHAIPLPQDKADEARRRTRKQAKKKGYTPSADTLYLSGWMLILTTLPVDILDTETVAALYRVRWQVELVIKRLKSLLDIDRLRAPKGSVLSELYLHGKLLYAAVTEKIAYRRLNLFPAGMIPERTHTPWRILHLLASEVKSLIIASMPAQAKYKADFIKAICERPRKRKLQTLPATVFQLLDACRALGVSCS